MSETTISKPIKQKYLDRIGERYFNITIIDFEYISYIDKKGKKFGCWKAKCNCDCGKILLSQPCILSKSCHDCYIKNNWTKDSTLIPEELKSRIGEIHESNEIIGIEWKIRKNKKGNTFKQLFLRARCQCGNETLVPKEKIPPRCGPCAKQYFKPIYVKHGMTYTSEYSTWNTIYARCYNPNHKSYKDYGGRGLTMDPTWIGSFEAFIADMGEKPEPKKLYSIDRLNNDLGYFKENCRWVNWNIQSNNRRKREYKYQIICEYCDKINFSLYSNNRKRFCDCKCAALFKYYENRYKNGFPIPQDLLHKILTHLTKKI